MHYQQSRLSRRDFLRTMAISAGALTVSSTLAACMPTAPAGEAGAASAPAADGKVKLELWTFADTHARWFRAMAEDYVKNVNPNFELNVTEIAYNDMHDKLQVALQTGGVGAPDIADIEQGRFGGFLRGADPGLVDLKDRLTEGGYLEQLVASREALYTHKGKVYGVEHALCPVASYYRSDIYEAAGVDLNTVETWDDFITVAKQVSTDEVKAIPFSDHDMLLRQRGSDYFDEEGNVTLDSALSVETADWLLALRDTHGIAAQAPGGSVYTDTWYAAVREGKFLGHIGADWYAGFFRDNTPELKGKMKATLMPAFEKGGIRTSCVGGTGCTIVKTSPNVEEAWNYFKFTMLSPDGNARRYEMTKLWPPLIPAMSDPRLHNPDEFYSGQDLGEIFAKVGPDVPAQYQSPYRAELNAKLGPLWQDIYDGKTKPTDVFKQVADEIRDVIAKEQA